MSLRLKLALAFAALAAVVLATTLALTYSALESAATQKVAADVHGAVQLFTNYVSEYRARTALQIESSFSSNSAFANELDPLNSEDDEFGLVSESESREETARKLQGLHQLIASADLTELKRNALFVVTNRRGEVVFNLADPARFGQTLSQLPLLNAAFSGRSGAALWSDRRLSSMATPLLRRGSDAQDDLLLVVSQPIRRGDKVLGAVLLGESVMPRLAAFEAMNGGSSQHATTRLALESPEAEFAGRDPLLLRALIATRAGAKDADGFLLDAEGRTFAVQGVRFGADQPLAGSRAFLMRDVKPEIADFIHAFFGKTFFLSLLGILLIALFFTQLLSRRLTWPLVRLEAAAREIQRGNLDVQVAPLGRDEVGRLAETFNEMVFGLKQRDQIKGLFKRYLDPRVVDELIRHPEKASPGGERRVLTLLFSDLVGFTTASEKLSPEELVALLNRYFETATRALAKHGATLDKFIGDAIMCFWNAPLPDDAHAAKACLSALALLDVVDALREPFRAAGFDTFDCRVGINTGPCVVGNLGSMDAQYYTAIGDAVNLASRLEGACKVYGTRTLVSHATVLAAKDAVAVRELDLVRVKGRGHPVRVFELLGPAGTALPEHALRYQEGLALFRDRRFTEALASFLKSPADPPSQVFAERCRDALATPPSEDWDAVHTLSTK